jgi:GNAT superfamily N-acetyltransferase
MGVRPIEAADRAQVAEWKRALWGDDGGDLDETVFVWESEDGALGGFVSLSLRPWAEGCVGSPVPYVEGWYVAESLRRQGIGRALVDRAEAWAREAGFTELGSDVLVDNALSLQTHRRLGFLPTERLQFFRKSLEPAAPATPVRVEHHIGSRAELRPLFELAEDSPAQLDSYLESGRVLVAVRGEEILGHLQLTETDDASEIEIKNMAVVESHRRRGVGRTLLATAIELAREESRRTVCVATAAADLDNLRFYQQSGFRMRSIERDAFTIATGYAAGTSVDGIELRDRVRLDLPLGGEA